jgi:hypothetical protein
MVLSGGWNGEQGAGMTQGEFRRHCA